jgi:cobalt-zinc-cadmium efflux system protein
MFTGWFIVDPILSVLIGFTIVSAAWSMFREGLRVLLEATPRQVDITQMVDALKEVPGVKGVHDVHVWSISPEVHAMSCHVLTDDILSSKVADIRRKIEDLLRQRFHIEHTTLQMECQECGVNDIFCKLALRPGGNEKAEVPPEADTPNTCQTDTKDS